MEGARSGARLLHSNATSNAASAAPARLRAGPDGGSPRGTQPPGRQEEGRKESGGRGKGVRRRGKNQRAKTGHLQSADLPSPPRRHRGPATGGAPGPAAPCLGRAGGESRGTARSRGSPSPPAAPSPAPARHPVSGSSRAPTCVRASVRRRGGSRSPAKATASPTESPCRSAPSPPAPHFLSRPLRLEIPGETRSSSHTEGRARPGRSARRRRPGAGPALAGCT